MSSKYYKNSIKKGFNTLQKVVIIILVIILIPIGLFEGIKYAEFYTRSNQISELVADALHDKGYHYSKITYIERMDKLPCDYEKTHRLLVADLVSNTKKSFGNTELYYKAAPGEYGHITNLPTDSEGVSNEQ